MSHQESDWEFRRRTYDFFLLNGSKILVGSYTVSGAIQRVFGGFLDFSQK